MSEDKVLSFPEKKVVRKGFPYPEDFLAFYEAYPRKIAKGEAYKAWTSAKVHPYLPETAELTAIVSLWNERVYQYREPNYIPHPATWLRARTWEDEPPAVDHQKESDEDLRKRYYEMLDRQAKEMMKDGRL
jgi:hypothetical protein